MKTKKSVLEYNKKYYEKNKKQVYEKQQEWQQKHEEHIHRYKEEEKQRNSKILHDLKINGCAICGYNKCDNALEFHHTNPRDKIFSIGTLRGHLAEELNKCILLCANCHKEIHSEEKHV